MENAAPPPVTVAGGAAGRKEPSTDPVKAQGILTSVSRKEKHAARLWQQRWGFYTKIREFQDEEALKIGLSLDEYRAAVRSVNCQPEPKRYPVVVDPSPKPLPPTSSEIVGRRALCPLERYGRLVKTGCDYPRRPPRPPPGIYDPYKQTMFFLGSVTGDPISHKLPQARCEVTDEMWARPQQLSVIQFDQPSLERAMRTY